MNEELDNFEKAHALSKGVMNGGFVWKIDGPAINQAAEHLYLHYKALFPTWYWQNIPLVAVQSLVRAQILQWAKLHDWDAPVFDEVEEDHIWGWLADGTVRFLHTGSYR